MSSKHTSPDWHTLDIEQLQRRLASDVDGLTQQEANLRLQRFGPNRLPETKPRSAWRSFLAQFHNLLIYVLISAGMVTLLLQHWLDAAVIFGVVIINALIGFLQEGKAEDALRAIRSMLAPRAQVVRDGRLITLDAQQLVAGDLVPLQAGDRVPADMRLILAKGLQIEEAALTGESLPVEKSVAPLPLDTALGDRFCMAYSGTLVTRGQGKGLVVATGAETEIGRISTLMAGVEQLTTPLLRQLDIFGRKLTLAILGLALISFLFGVLLRDYTVSEMFMASVGLAVAAIPEGLPAIMTITLAIGVQRMAARNAIIRRLPAVETLGTVAVICSDKTGTLTRNEMTVREIVTPDLSLKVSGVGYDPHGAFQQHEGDFQVVAGDPVWQLLWAGLLCNDATLSCQDGSWCIQGDPMEAALLTLAVKAGLDPDNENERTPRSDLIPFDAAHQFMATLHHDHQGQAYTLLKGAPERVLAMCEWQGTCQERAPLNKAIWHSHVEQLASKGYRVLAVAQQCDVNTGRELRFQDVESGLVLLGLLGLIDPPRDESISATELCQQAGIRVKMITGDHALTASAIARQIGLENPTEVITGKDLDAMDDAALLQRVSDVDVYARVTPEHKLRLVTAMQQQGAVIAMTGDGVNDAPALKRADVGVAMGRNGTEVAKEAAEMVLADDNFASIVHAVEEGRTVYDNIRKAILFILPTNGGEALVILGAILLGFHNFPLTPVQILWVNMITAVTLALVLAFDPPDAGVMKRSPRVSDERLLSGWFLWRIGFVSLILMSGTFALFLWALSINDSIAHARTVAVNTLVMFEIFYLFNTRFIEGSVFKRSSLTSNRFALPAVGLLLLFQMGFTYLPPMQRLFGTAAIGPTAWLLILGVGSSVLFLVELEKLLIRFFRRSHQRQGRRA
ncbi:MAG: cation-transporting P-type ATPase [Candidatus Thiodiazotropha sp.]